MTETPAMTFARPALLATLLGCASMSHAIEQDVTIKGVVYAAIPCVINKDAPITAPFGDVNIADIGGDYKKITLEYSLDCSRSVSNELRIQVRGAPSFNSALLAVQGQDNLGIALKQDGAALVLNHWYNFDPRRKPVLQALLVKRTNSVIQAGSLNASATLVVDYR